MTGTAQASTQHLDASRLRELWADPDGLPALAALLVAHSRLPGPRANLQLAATFADAVGASGANDAQWRLLDDWLAISATHAPSGEPREFLPFCALQALGPLFLVADAPRRDAIIDRLRTAASDERWRTRESVAIALQRIGAHSAAVIERIIGAWLPQATLLEQRAIVAALAHPPLLRDPGTARYALAIADQMLATVRALDRAARKTEEFRVLRQTLEYAISVLVAAQPDEGFARLSVWARMGDPDTARVVRANLGKARLAKRYPAQVRQVLATL